MPATKNNGAMGSQLNTASIDQLEESRKDNGYGFNITKMVDALGKPMKYTVNEDYDGGRAGCPLKPGQKFAFTINWNYKISDRMKKGNLAVVVMNTFRKMANHLFSHGTVVSPLRLQRCCGLAKPPVYR